MADSILLDTRAALWLMGGEPMSEGSLAAIRGAQVANLGVHVSLWTAWEIGVLVSRKRMQLALSPEVWFEKLLALPGIRLAALTPKILFAASTLPGAPPDDVIDRILAATARSEGHVIVTRNPKLLAFAQQGHIRVEAC